MRTLAGLAVIVAAWNASAAPQTLVGQVDYDFVDQNGFGWATTTGEVTVTLELDGKQPALKITGKRRSRDGRVSGTAAPMDVDKWEGDVDETYPLRDITRAKTTITFKLDPVHDKLTATCAPIKVPEIARKTLYECGFTGFQWRTIPSLPELHHPIVLDGNTKAKTRLLNTMSGKTRRLFGQRKLSERAPAKPAKHAKQR